MDRSELAPGTPVRAHFHDPQDIPVANRTLHGVVRVDGEVVRAETESLILSATTFEFDRGLENTAQGNTVVVPVVNVQALEGKEIHIGRSAAFAGASVAFLFLLDQVFMVLGGSSEGGPGGGDPTPR